jgi:hypothetical protein
VRAIYSIICNKVRAYIANYCSKVRDNYKKTQFISGQNISIIIEFHAVDTSHPVVG